MKKTDNTENKITLTVSQQNDLDYYVKEFGRCWGAAEDNIQHAADAFWQATNLIGFKEAVAVFHERYAQLRERDWQMLADIGAHKVDVRVFMLPDYMHGIARMKITDQWALLNNKRLGLYKFATEKPCTIDLGKVNESDWRVAFDREKNRLRTSEEQLKYIRDKKWEFKQAVHWKLGSKSGTVVFTSGCTLTKTQLQEIMDLL